MQYFFKLWQKLKLRILQHEKILWVLHSVWALTYGVLIMLFFHGDFGQVRKLLFFLIFLMLLILIFDRVVEYENRQGTSHRGFKIVINYVMKNMYQALYFFMLPFYWQAAYWLSIQWVFTVLLGIFAILSTQDLFFDNFLMERKWFRNLYFSFCLLASFHLMLPVLLPLPLHFTLPLAAFVATLSFFLLHMTSFVFQEHHLRWVVLFSVVAALFVYLLQPVVPPVPYHVVHSGVTGESLVSVEHQTPSGVYFIPSHELQHRPLYGYSLLESPTFPHDLFRHEYWHRGRLVVSTRAARQKIGPHRYRLVTQLNWKEQPALHPEGIWSMRLVTAGGVIMDSVDFEVVQTQGVSAHTGIE